MLRFDAPYKIILMTGVSWNGDVVFAQTVAARPSFLGLAWIMQLDFEMLLVSAAIATAIVYIGHRVSVYITQRFVLGPPGR